MDRKEELREIAKKELPDTVVALGYAEHQMDLMGQLILDILSTIDQTTLSQPVLDRITDLKNLMAYSSIDFANITDQMQSYKLPMATQTKALTRQIQGLYLEAQIREGLFGK